MKYRTIYMDPPWKESGGGKIKRGADRHYPLMKTADIITLLQKELDGKVEDHAHLYLWVTNNFMQDGFKVMEALGFKYKTMITWAKDKFGLGQYFRGQTEHCLFGVKGFVPYKVVDGKRQQGTTLLNAPRGRHSAKPHDMYDIIEKVSTGPFIEFFARNTREGWESWGNEVNVAEIQEKDLFVKTKRIIKEETNDKGETTYFISGEYSLDGSEWKHATIIWDGDMHGR